MASSVSQAASALDFAPGEKPSVEPLGQAGNEPLVRLAPVEPGSEGPPSRIRTSKEKLRVKLYAALLGFDLISILFAFAAADFIRFGHPLVGPGLHLAMAFAPIYIFLAFHGKAYSIEVLAAPRLGMWRAFIALATTAAALSIALFYSKTAGDVSRIVFGAGSLGALVLIVSIRYSLGQVFGQRHGWNFINEVLLVDGVKVSPGRGQIVVFAGQAGLSPDANDPRSFDRLGRLLGNCDRVVLASESHRRRDWARMLKCAGISVEVMTPELDQLGPLELRQSVGGSAVLVAAGPLGLRDRLAKRLLDLAIAIPALILASPIMLISAVAIALTSRGPILFRQERVGQGNRLFDVYKFRTMRIEGTDHSGARSASRGDDRVTSVGRILRSASVDELPQLFNVLKGEMSIVGPRPHALGSTAQESLFWDVDARYWQRGAIKPGITGLAQVRGLRGATHLHQDITDRVQADLEYLAGWSLLRDVHIMFRTIRVLVHTNAY